MSSYTGKITWYKILRTSPLWTYHDSHSCCCRFLSSGLEPGFWPWAWEEQMEGFLHLAHARVNQVQQMMIQWGSVQNRQEGWQSFCRLYSMRAFCFILLFCKWATTSGSEFKSLFQVESLEASLGQVCYRYPPHSLFPSSPIRVVHHLTTVKQRSFQGGIASGVGIPSGALWAWNQFKGKKVSRRGEFLWINMFQRNQNEELCLCEFYMTFAYLM